MEILVLCGLVLVTLITVCVVHILLTHKSNIVNGSRASTPPLPPGRLGFPLIGESIDFWLRVRSGKSENFVFSRMAKFSSHVFKTSIVAETTAVMCGSAASLFLFSNDKKLVKQVWPLSVGTLLAPCRLSPFPLKNIILTFFTGDSLKKQVQILNTIVRQHLTTEWQGHDQVVVLPLAKQYAFTVACRLALSVEDVETIGMLNGHVTAILLGLLKPKINLPGTPYNRALKAWNGIRKMLSEMVRLRRKELQACNYQRKASDGDFHDTLSDILVAANENGVEISDEDVANRLVGVLIVIHDTTSVIITMIFKYLAKHPNVYDIVRRENMELAAKKAPGEPMNWDDTREMQYSWNVTREVLRVCPPAQALFREATTDFTYAGYHIPKGWKILLSIKAIHMDPRYFEEPEKFDPARFVGEGPLPNTFIPFGGGQHFCPGKNFAQVLVLVFIHHVVRRFRWDLMNDCDEELLVDPIPRPTSGVHVRLYRYAHPSNSSQNTSTN